MTAEPPFLDDDFRWAALVPEFLVADIGASLRFWRDICGFRVLFDRPEDGFAYLDLSGAQITAGGTRAKP